jgi:hypothetical protein
VLALSAFVDWLDTAAGGSWRASEDAGGVAGQRFGFPAFGKEAVTGEMVRGTVADGWSGLLSFAASWTGVAGV